LELKRGRTDDQVVGQISRYMGWVRENLSPNQVVRGIIVIGSDKITRNLKYAMIGQHQITDQLIRVKNISPQNWKT